MHFSSSIYNFSLCVKLFTIKSLEMRTPIIEIAEIAKKNRVKMAEYFSDPPVPSTFINSSSL